MVCISKATVGPAETVGTFASYDQSASNRSSIAHDLPVGLFFRLWPLPTILLPSIIVSGERSQRQCNGANRRQPAGERESRDSIVAYGRNYAQSDRQVIRQPHTYLSLASSMIAHSEHE